MNDIIKTYQERFRRSRHDFRRYAALLLALAMITTLFVNWQLHGVGISMTADYQCGEVEHTHTADCYEKVLVCGYEEGEVIGPGTVSEPVDDSTADTDSDIAQYTEPEYIFVPHVHTDDCYTAVQTLTCLEEEHVHDDDCFDPEDGSLICDKFEHTHDESCYTTDYELTCGLEDGELVEELNPDYVPPVAQFEAPVVVEPVVEPEVHHHTDACYEEVLVCPFKEHHHTVNCLSDQTADVETEDEWLAQTDTTLDGFWSDDLIRVAQSQLGYEQSEKNFQLDGDDNVTVRHYTRYGQSYGNPYGEWDVMFLSYCLKYAQIPQSAVPQEASVLALRSAMSSMEWLLDGADGAAAAPGDIVIYQKDATRTVAVDTAENSVDTQTSDDYGISTLPAVVDDTTKPVTVDDDFTVPTTSEPQTTTVTSRVDTVGIVESIDEDTGMLTVISGDVDGKVAEVQLAPVEVEGVISVVSAQMAYEGGTTTLEIKYIDTFEELPDDYSKGGITKVEITVNNKVQTGPIELKDGDKITLDYSYSIPADTFKDGEKDRKLTYQLPVGIKLSSEIKGQEILQNGKVVGTMDVSKDGLVTLHISDDFDAHQPFTGSFGFEAKVTTKDLGDGGTIKFPGDSTTITVTDPKDISSSKTGSIVETSDGNTYIDYTITVKSDKGWSDKVYIKDKLSNSDSVSTSYVKNSFVLKDKKGNIIDQSQYTLTWDADGNGFSIDGLPEMAKGEQYVLTYRVKLDKVKADENGSYTINNNKAWTNDEKPSTPWIKHEQLLYKSGKYDPDTGLITWVVTVTNYYGGKIPAGYKLTDAIKTDGQKIVGDITVTERQHRYWGDETLFDTITDANGKSSFEYVFPKDGTGEEYKFTYKTTAPDGAKTEVKNEASVPGGSTTVGTWTDDRSWNLKKEATNSSLTETDKENIYKAYWKITTAVPNNWDTKTIRDFIYSPKNDNEGKHYGIAAELDAEIKKNLRFNCTDSSSLTYEQAIAAGIGIEITYYDTVQDKVTDENVIPASDTSKEVHSFKIKLTNNYRGDKRIKELVIDDYYTYVDVTGVPNDQKVKYENKAGSSAYYEYEKKTPETPSEIKKGVSTYNPGNISWGSNQEVYGKSVTVDYNNNGKTYLYYQVLVDVSERKNVDGSFMDDTITIADKLPEGVTYVDGSTEAVWWTTDGGYDIQAYTKWNLSTDGGGTIPRYRLFTDPTFFEITATGTASEGQTLNFNFKKLHSLDLSTAGSTNKKGFLIRYTVELDTTSDDSIWRDPDATTNQYTNKVSWNGHSDDATATVNRVVTVLDKEGQQSKNKDGQKTSGADYTIKINPTGKNLVPGKNYLTLTDTLTVEKGFTATLDLDSVKLYDANDLDNPLPDTLYTFTYSTSVNANGENVYTMVLTVPDQRALVLKYSYSTNAKNQEVKLKNTADLEGKWESGKDKTLDNVNGWASMEQGLLTIHKVDSLNQKIGLKNAEFTLSRFDPETGKWDTAHNQAMRTDKDGKITIYVGSSQDVTMEATSLYRLTETAAPDGYRKSDAVYYFIWTPNEWTGTDQELYEKVVGSNVQSGEEVPELTNVHVFRYGTGHDLYVKNDRSQLTIQKFWTNKYNESMTPEETEVTVKLYRYPKGGNRSDAVQVGDPIKLTSADNWTYAYKSVEAGYLYFIEEASTGKKYDVTYSDSNTTGVENGGLLTLTNKERSDDGYELPSTGGAGTTPFTAVGGTLMLTALVYGVRRKRRHEGRAED